MGIQSDIAYDKAELAPAVDRLNGLLIGGEDWLVARVSAHAAAHGYGPHRPEAWRESVSSISDALFQAAYDPRALREHEAGALDHDPITAFGVLRARSQYGRRTTLAGWLGLMRYYRRAFVELVQRAGLSHADEAASCDFVERFFDKLEAGFAAEWARLVASQPPDA